jgi:hypothetical protein
MVVGCGGTGGWVAESLCRILMDRPEVSLVLVDPDTVEPLNLVRQNYYPEELGQFKARALAERLARRYRRPIAYSLDPFHSPGRHMRGMGQLVAIVGCVDNYLARREIATAMRPNPSYSPSALWWVDSGNGPDWGQVLVGNRQPEDLGAAFNEEFGICYKLPLPTVQHPGLAEAPEAPRKDPTCAVAVEAGEQSPSINQAMAMLVVEAVRKLLLGELTWMQAYISLGEGTMRVVEATPESVGRITGLRKNRLMVRRPKQTQGRR